MASRILLVVPNVPYPLISGGHLRDWQILNLLNRLGTKPAVLYFGAGEGRALAPGSAIEPLCSSIEFGGDRVEEPDAGALAKLGWKLRYLSGTNGDRLPFSRQYDAINAGGVILRAAVRLGVDVVILRSFWCHHTPALKQAGFRIVANCPDDNTTLAREMIRSVHSLPRKLGPACNYVAVRRQERAWLPVCDEVWVPTSAEIASMSKFVPRTNLLHLPNLVDVASHPVLARASAEPGSLLFVANYGYAPNANGARRLLENVFPRIRRQIADARLYLVGDGLPADLTARARSTAGVVAPGFVEDLEPWYRRAAVVLVPVIEGAGMLFKAIEALALGKAVVGMEPSFRGMEGFDPSGPAPFVAVRAWSALADEAIRLLGDLGARASLGERARQFAERRLSWEVGVRCLEQSIVARFPDGVRTAEAQACA